MNQSPGQHCFLTGLIGLLVCGLEEKDTYIHRVLGFQCTDYRAQIERQEVLPIRYADLLQLGVQGEEQDGSGEDAESMEVFYHLF